VALDLELRGSVGHHTGIAFSQYCIFTKFQIEIKNYFQVFISRRFDPAWIIFRQN
jgi:hypothetical protein